MGISAAQRLFAAWRLGLFLQRHYFAARPPVAGDNKFFPLLADFPNNLARLGF